MRKNSKSISRNPMADEFGAGIFIGRASIKELHTLDKDVLNTFEASKHSHRDDYHLFFLLERGEMPIEVDFNRYTITSPAVFYISPDQVHRMIGFENTTISYWAISSEHIKHAYLPLLEELTPSEPLSLKKETLSLIIETVSLCIKFFQCKNEKLFQSFLSDSCNALIALTISQYMEHPRSPGQLTRFEVITRSFKKLLEKNYTTAKKPNEYAQALNISTPYLNESIKEATGYSVTHHIQQRIILEAKRQLFHSDKTVKEIAIYLGYNDDSYFSRFFSSVTGDTPLAFRKKNSD